MSLPQGAVACSCFARAYRAAIGVTPARTVEHLRIAQAATALTETPLPLKDIARRCGLGNEQNLRRLFHRHHGISPATYRERFSAHGCDRPSR